MLRHERPHVLAKDFLQQGRFAVHLLMGSLRRDVHDLGHPFGPTESILPQTLVPEAEAIAIPVQHLDGVAYEVAEDEEVPGERGQIEDALYRYAHSLSKPVRMSVAPGVRFPGC